MAKKQPGCSWACTACSDGGVITSSLRSLTDLGGLKQQFYFQTEALLPALSCSAVLLEPHVYKCLGLRKVKKNGERGN